MELYRERGFDRTTVADIAARAGLTERTFFRYFADKREVLFWGSGTLQEFLVDQGRRRAGSMPPMDAVAGGAGSDVVVLRGAARASPARASPHRAHADLKERELIKLASLAAAIGEALHNRGVPAPAANLAAETGVAIFKLAFERWVNDARRVNSRNTSASCSAPSRR